MNRVRTALLRTSGRMSSDRVRNAYTYHSRHSTAYSGLLPGLGDTCVLHCVSCCGLRTHPEGNEQHLHTLSLADIASVTGGLYCDLAVIAACNTAFTQHVRRGQITASYVRHVSQVRLAVPGSASAVRSQYSQSHSTVLAG